jgi:hypothetical protein
VFAVHSRGWFGPRPVPGPPRRLPSCAPSHAIGTVRPPPVIDYCSGACKRFARLCPVLRPPGRREMAWARVACLADSCIMFGCLRVRAEGDSGSPCGHVRGGGSLCRDGLARKGLQVCITRRWDPLASALFSGRRTGHSSTPSRWHSLKYLLRSCRSRQLVAKRYQSHRPIRTQVAPEAPTVLSGSVAERFETCKLSIVWRLAGGRPGSDATAQAGPAVGGRIQRHRLTAAPRGLRWQWALPRPATGSLPGARQHTDTPRPRGGAAPRSPEGRRSPTYPPRRSAAMPAWHTPTVDTSSSGGDGGCRHAV